MATTLKLQQQKSTVQGYDYDLAIVGGGIVGATLACALKDSGLTVVLIEAQPHSEAAAKGQAYNLSLMSSRIYQGIGVWSEIEPKLTPYQQIRLSDADCPQVVQFFPKDLGLRSLQPHFPRKTAPALGYVAEHEMLLQALQNFLQDCPNVEWLCPAKVTRTAYETDGVHLDLASSSDIPAAIRVRLVVAADGARSQIREKAGIGTHGWQYWQSCIVATISPEKPHSNIAYERFWPSGPFAILPLPGNRCRIVWTAPHAEAQTLAALDDTQFLQELRRRYGDQMGQLSLIGDRFVFPVKLMHANRYILPGLALVGDAAHCCHPVGGQGLNSGIQDVAALAEVIKLAQQQGEDIASLRVLKRYERWRRLENLAILSFTDFLDRLFSNHWLPLVVGRRLGLRLMQAVQPLKFYALKFMTGLSSRLPKVAQN